MICAWEALISILPPWMRREVDKSYKNKLQQINLRIGCQPYLLKSDGCILMHGTVSKEDIQFCVNTATKYSPWAAQTIKSGYITAQGGHRIGVCGEMVMNNGIVTGIRDINSLCIRVAGDFPGIARSLTNYVGSILIIGSPGCGKTTLLRDLIRQLSAIQTVGVVDQREELFPMVGGNSFFSKGEKTDIITCCDKARAIEILIRNMAPDAIAMDEITAKQDCEALIGAAWCGVRLLATAHASEISDLMNRHIYRPIIESRIFNTVVILQKDKSWKAERIRYDS